MNKKKWKYELRDIHELYPNPKNPRQMSEKYAQLLEKSIKRFGICEPIIITEEGTIIGGHQRYNVFLKLGVRMVPVMVSQGPIDEEEAKELCILLNKAIGTWDHDILSNDFDFEKLLELGFCHADFELDSDTNLEIPKSYTITIKCKDEQNFDEIHHKISQLLNNFPESTYKVKIN